MTTYVRSVDRLYPETRQALAAIFDSLLSDIPALAKGLRGRKGGLRPSAPKDEVLAYVWRMARLHSGHDPSIPATAEFTLARGLETRLKAQGLTRFVEPHPDDLCRHPDRFYSTDIPRECTDRVDGAMTAILKELGEDPLGGARRWRGLL